MRFVIISCTFILADTIADAAHTTIQMEPIAWLFVTVLVVASIITDCIQFWVKD